MMPKIRKSLLKIQIQNQVKSQLHFTAEIFFLLILIMVIVTQSRKATPSPLKIFWTCSRETNLATTFINFILPFEKNCKLDIVLEALEKAILSVGALQMLVPTYRPQCSNAYNVKFKRGSKCVLQLMVQSLNT